MIMYLNTHAALEQLRTKVKLSMDLDDYIYLIRNFLHSLSAFITRFYRLTLTDFFSDLLYVYLFPFAIMVTCQTTPTLDTNRRPCNCLGRTGQYKRTYHNAGWSGGCG